MTAWLVCGAVGLVLLAVYCLGEGGGVYDPSVAERRAQRHSRRVVAEAERINRRYAREHRL